MITQPEMMYKLRICRCRNKKSTYEAAPGCDLLFSCMDRLLGRDVVNFIAYSHLIPGIDGGVAEETQNGDNHSVHWAGSHLGTRRQWICCNG